MFRPLFQYLSEKIWKQSLKIDSISSSGPQFVRFTIVDGIDKAFLDGGTADFPIGIEGDEGQLESVAMRVSLDDPPN